MVSKSVSIFAGFAFVAIVVVCSVATFKIIDNRPNTQPAQSNSGDFLSNLSGATTQHVVKDMCQSTHYKEECESSLSKASNSSSPKDIVKAGFQVIVDQVKLTINESVALKRAAADHATRRPYRRCKKFLDDSVHDLERTVDRFDSFEISDLKLFIADLQTWLTGALTFQDTCRDYFNGTTSETGDQMRLFMKQSRMYTINGLGLVNYISNFLSNVNSESSTVSSRRLLSDIPLHQNEGLFPKSRGRELAASDADVVVALDGSGDFKTIKEALAKVPTGNTKRFTIHIKKGVYKETVFVTRDMLNVAFVGDGPEATVITGSKSVKGNGVETPDTATVNVEGDFFMAKDMGFENTAGPEMEQAVAIRVSSDFSVFYNCKFDGFQDTIYVHAHRQFYSKCTITGTVDFIFGKAQAVFEDCKIFFKKPIPTHKYSMVTANGREDPEDTSAIVLYKCSISSMPDYPLGDPTFTSYLGRGWGKYSRAIVMNSNIDSVIDPRGWSPWEMEGPGCDTCYFAEVGNKGPGADTSKRVTWPSIKLITPTEGSNFGPKSYIQADTWLPKAGVSY